MQTAPKTADPTPSRMTLASVTRGKQARPWRILIYGVEGIGKSTLASQAPNPIFLGPEDGTGHLDVARFPAPLYWRDVLAAVKALTADAHDFKTLVIDTVDWLEPLVWEHVCRRDQMASIEDYGYGKGYQAALEEWRPFLTSLEPLRDKGMNVLLLGHTHLKTFKNPEGEDFDRYELKLHLKAGGLLKEWSDAVLFANHETYAKKDEKTKRVRGVSTGSRWLYTVRSAAYDAKNRFGLRDMIPLNWADLESGMAAPQSSDTDTLLEEIRRKSADLGGDDAKRVSDALARAGRDATKLAQLNTWCNSQLTLKAEKAGKKA